MRWQIAQFVFCDQQQTLTSEQRTQQLEPMLVELLSYFCQNRDRIISKNQLIEQVWLGRVVSDNAVSKSITKLRKAFADDVRQPRFIATFPKKGYKFIGIVHGIEEKQTVGATESKKAQVALSDTSIALLGGDTELRERNKFRFTPFVISLCLILVAGAYFFAQQLQDKPIMASHAKALTTDAGDELFPSFSPDGSRVSYMMAKQGRMHLMIKNVIDGNIVEVNHKGDLGVGPADWSKDGKMLVYLVATPQLCQYFIRDVIGSEFGKPQLLHECPAGSYGKIVFTHDNHRLIYSENAGGNSPYSLYEIDTITGKKKRLNQPELYLGGNSQFDLHPTENKLLVSSPDEQQWEGFYSLDLETEELELLFKQDAYICCGIWNHIGDRVILMGEHPAYQLISYDLAGKDRTVIYSGSRKIRRPSRHVNGTDYLFTSGETNVNFNILDLASTHQQVIANDSIDELLATFSHHSDQIAYTSLASGNEEIWLTDIYKRQRKKLTQFNDSRHYIDLVWSHAGDYLLALTLNEIHMISTTTGESKKLAIPQTEIRGVSFKSESIIAYSIKEGNRWRVYNFQINDARIVPEDPRWQFIQYGPEADNILWLDQAGELYSGKMPARVSTLVIPGRALVSGRQFNLKKRGLEWYWFELGERNAILKFSEQSQNVTTILQTDVAHFDIRNNRLLFGEVHHVNSNLYQTQVLK